MEGGGRGGRIISTRGRIRRKEEKGGEKKKK